MTNDISGGPDDPLASPEGGRGADEVIDCLGLEYTDDQIADIRKAVHNATPIPSETRGLREAYQGRFIERVLQDACELPDRTSPDDQPEMLMMTGDELSSLLERAFEAFPPTQPQPDSDGLWDAAEWHEEERDNLRKRLDKDPKNPFAELTKLGIEFHEECIRHFRADAYYAFVKGVGDLWANARTALATSSPAHAPAKTLDDVARDCATKIVGFDPRDSRYEWSAANKADWNNAVAVITAALRRAAGEVTDEMVEAGWQAWLETLPEQALWTDVDFKKALRASITAAAQARAK